MSKGREDIRSQIEKWMNRPWKLKGVKKFRNEIVKKRVIKYKQPEKNKRRNSFDRCKIQTLTAECSNYLRLYHQISEK